MTAYGKGISEIQSFTMSVVRRVPVVMYDTYAPLEKGGVYRWVDRSIGFLALCK